MITFSSNLSIAVSNPCILAASILQVLASILVFQGKQETKTSSRKKLFAAAYFVSVIFVLASSTVALLGHYPMFFVASGPTLLRQVFLGSSVFFFAVAALIFGIQYFRSKSLSIYWYALAIGLFSSGLFSAFEQKSIGDIPTWLGRIALYIGTVYLMAAILSSRVKSEGTDTASAWAESFRSNPKQVNTFFSKMLNGYAYCKILTNKAGKPIDYIFLDTNEAFEQSSGLKKQDILGKKASETINADALEDWLSVVGPVAITGEPVTLDHLSKVSNKWRHLSIYSPQKGYFISISEDIDDRKKAEEEIRKSEEEYSSLFSNMIDGFAYCQMIFDEVGKPIDFVYLQINDEFERITGLKRDVVVGKKVTEAIPGINEANPELFEIYGRVASTCQKEKIEVFFKPLRLWLSISVYCPNKGYFAAVFEDITAHKAAEEEVLESEKRLNRSQEIAHLGSWELDLTNNKLSWSDEVYRIFGLKPQEFGATYEAFLQAVHPDDRKAVDDAYSGSLREGKDTYEIEHRVVRRSTGEIRVVHEKSEHIRDENGKIIRSIGMVQDITERKIMEDKLEEYGKNLEKLVEERTNQLKGAERLAAIGATAGMVGHDIRNPLQAIISDVYLIKAELALTPETDEKKNALEGLIEIENNIEYINKIVVDLQDYARPLTPVFKATNLENLCQEIFLKSNITKNIKTSCKIEKPVKEIMADPDLLKRIISNLVLNAIQAMPKGGKLSVYAYSKEGGLVIEVSDTGEGIPDEVKTKMFTPMFTTKSKGQGFGLAVVKRVTESMNGAVTFESEIGKGTKFIIELPIP